MDLLVGDDAPQWEWLSSEQALCWVHASRHYKKLRPATTYFQAELVRFREKFWEYYRKLLHYKEQPCGEEAQRLRTEFKQLFSTVTGYEELDKRNRLCLEHERELLAVLAHPEIPLHNNASELAARQRVRKRDSSYGPRTEQGKRAWDSLQSLVETCHKLEVNFQQYVYSRLSYRTIVANLGELIKAGAAPLNLSGSFEVTPLF